MYMGQKLAKKSQTRCYGNPFLGKCWNLKLYPHKLVDPQDVSYQKIIVSDCAYEKTSFWGVQLPRHKDYKYVAWVKWVNAVWSNFYLTERILIFLLCLE